MLAAAAEEVSAAVVVADGAQVLLEAGQPVLVRRPREAELLAPAPPVLAQLQVVVVQAVEPEVPVVRLSRQSFSAAMARSTT